MSVDGAQMTAWAYLAASVGIGLGLYLVVRSKERDTRRGSMLVAFGLAVFLGGSLTVTNLLPITGSFNSSSQIQSLSNQVSSLQADFRAQQCQFQTQTVSVNNVVTTVVNNIVDVRREVADMAALVTNLYSRVRIEQVRPTMAAAAQFIPDIAIKGQYGLGLLLAEPPIPASVSVSLISDQGVTVLPPVLFSVFRNMLMFSEVGSPSKYRDTTFVVSYVPDPLFGTNDVRGVSWSGNGVVGSPSTSHRPGDTPTVIFSATNIVPLRFLDGNGARPGP